ncbi:MAG: cold-shock protein [Calditrichaeota bacterium]|nr:MAG: cold-shock protein [Calditrichota bacterium]
MSERVTGIVKWFSSTKGYGFILHEEKGDVFVHYSAINSEGFRKLIEGQKVEYTLVKSEKGFQAQDVVILE